MPIYALDDLVPDIHPTAWVHPEAVVTGDVTIGADATVWPFAVLRGYAGTDLEHGGEVGFVECPFTGERLSAVRAINPDVSIIHAQHADRAGAHQVQSRRVGRAPAHDHGDVERRDELL